MESPPVNKPIRIVRASHMRYRHANMAETRQFLEDFGMRLAYKEGKRSFFAGEGPDPFVYMAEEVSGIHAAAPSRSCPSVVRPPACYPS